MLITPLKFAHWQVKKKIFVKNIVSSIYA